METHGIKLVAACDTDATRVAVAKSDFPDARTFTSIDELMAWGEFDLVTVILPHNLHAPVAIQASQAGKHVVVEKPMSISVAEADAMIAAAEKAGKMLSVFHNRRWDSDFNLIKKRIEEGLIGEVFKMEACMGHLHAPGQWWRADKSISGGALFDWGAHIIDWMLRLVPEPVAGVDGYFHKRRWHQMTNEDHTEVTIRFESGKTGSVEISSLSARSKDRWRILGTQGAIWMPSWDRVHVAVDHHGHIASWDERPGEGDWHGYYRNVAAHLTEGAELEVKSEQARRNIAIIEAAEESSRLGRTVTPAHR
jgi:predicted dehydrogenase